MIVDILYVSWNRLAYTRESFTALIENTDWGLVDRLFVHDDGSTDGTAEWLNATLHQPPVEVLFSGERVGGPVAAMNWYLDQPARLCPTCRGTGEAPPKPGFRGPFVCLPCDGHGTQKPVATFAKIDNDFVVCPGWLNDLTDVLTDYPSLDVLGAEPWFGAPQPYGTSRDAMFTDPDGDPINHVGGKGLIRRRIFSQCRPVPGGFNGYQGWTQYQSSHPEVVKAWIEPDLACFGLDQLPEGGSWRALAEGYAKQGWGRLWPPYGDASRYTSWWESRHL